MGVAGAGLASTIAIAVGTRCSRCYFRKLEKYIHIRPASWRPRLAVWGRMINIGLPAGGEFGFMFLYMAVIYWVIRDFGAAAQAGFGLGTRLMQSIFLPAMAIAFATGPIAGQNYGAKQYRPRARDVFRRPRRSASSLMLALTLLCQWRPEWLVVGFTKDPAVIEVASHFLRLVSFNFVASALIFTCSGHLPGPRPHLAGAGRDCLAHRHLHASRRSGCRPCRDIGSTRSGTCRSSASGSRP